MAAWTWLRLLVGASLLLQHCSAVSVVVSQPGDLFMYMADASVDQIIVEKDLDLLSIAPTCFGQQQDIVLQRSLTIQGPPNTFPAINWRWGGVNCTWAIRLAPGVTLTFANLVIKQCKGYVPDLVAGGDPSSTIIMDSFIMHRYTAVPLKSFLGIVPNLARPAWAPGSNIVAALPEGMCRPAPKPAVCWNQSVAIIEFSDTFVPTNSLGLGDPKQSPRLRLRNSVQVVEQYLSDECVSELYAKGKQDCVVQTSTALQEREAATGTGWISAGASPERVASTLAAAGAVFALNGAVLPMSIPASAQQPTVPTDSSRSTNITSSDDSSSSNNARKIGAIVGGTVGGVALLAMLACVALLAAKRSRQQQQAVKGVAGTKLDSATSDEHCGEGQPVRSSSKRGSVAGAKGTEVDIEACSHEPAGDDPSPGKTSTYGSPGDELPSVESGMTSGVGKAPVEPGPVRGSPLNTQLLLLDNSWLKLNEMVTPNSPLIAPVLGQNLQLGQNLLLGPRLGAGSMGSVYQGSFQDQAVAVKLFGPGTDRSSFISELSILGRTQHPNVVRLLGACVSDQQLALVEELADGSLEQVMYPGNGSYTADGPPGVSLPLDVVMHIAMEVATGLAYLHPTIIHRDLKPGNILLVTKHGHSKRSSALATPSPTRNDNSSTAQAGGQASKLLKVEPPPAPSGPTQDSAASPQQGGSIVRLGSPDAHTLSSSMASPPEPAAFPAAGAWLHISMSDASSPATVTNPSATTSPSTAHPDNTDVYNCFTSGTVIDWDSLQVKLSDFGLSRLFDSDTLITRTPHAGTIPYMAPECFNRQSQGLTHKCDIYSFSIVLWELLHCMRPWVGFTPAQVVYEVVVNKSRPLIFESEARVPMQLRLLIERCWNPDPDCRPPALEVVRELAVMQQQRQQHQQQLQQRPAM